MRRFSLPSTAVLVAAAIVVAPDTALAALDPTTDRQVGGVFSNTCGDRNQVMIRLYGDVLDVERAGVAVKAGRLQSDRKAQPGATVDYAATVRGVVKEGATRGQAVQLTITHNVKGLFARIDGGSEKALAPLGTGIVGQTVRHCDPNRNALPGAVAAGPVPQGPPELLRNPRFKAAYMKALGPLVREGWTTTLDGPAPQNRPITIAGAEYTLVAACKPHDCADHNLLLLWRAADAQVYGLLQQRGKQTLIGAPPPAVAGELPKLWAREYRR